MYSLMWWKTTFMYFIQGRVLGSLASCISTELSLKAFHCTVGSFKKNPNLGVLNSFIGPINII